MFDVESGCCCLCLTATSAPNTSMFDVASWMLCVYVWRCSSCTCARWLLSRAFAHEISLVDLIVFVGLVNPYYHVYVDVVSWLLRLCLAQCTRPVRRHSCPRHRRRRCYGSSSSLSCNATCSALAHEALPSDTSRSLLPIVVVVVVAAARRDMKMLGARARGLVVDIRRHHRRSCCRRRCDAIW